MRPNFFGLASILLKRFEVGSNNESLNDKIYAFLNNTAFQGTEEYLEMLAMCGNYIDLDPDNRLKFATHFERNRHRSMSLMFATYASWSRCMISRA